MGCGANSKSAHTTSRPQMLPTSLQPISDPSRFPVLPQVVLDGFAKCLRIPIRDPSYRKRRPEVNSQPFAGIIEDPLEQEHTSIGRKSQRNRDSGTEREMGFELVQATTGLAAPSNTIRRGKERYTEEVKDCVDEQGTLQETADRYGPFQLSEGTQESLGTESKGTFPTNLSIAVANTPASSAQKQEIPILTETSPTGLMDSEKSHPCAEHSLDPNDQMPIVYLVPLSSPDMSLPPSTSTPLADQASLPTNRPSQFEFVTPSLPQIPISADGIHKSGTGLEAPSLLIPPRLDPVPSNPEESAQSSEIPPTIPVSVGETAPKTSQYLATERLSRFYNSERGLSPMPSRPSNELSDDEDFEIAGLIDETRKAVQLAREKAAIEEANRLATRRAEEMSAQTGFSDAQKPETEGTMAKYQ